MRGGGGGGGWRGEGEEGRGRGVGGEVYIGRVIRCFRCCYEGGGFSGGLGGIVELS